MKNMMKFLLFLGIYTVLADGTFLQPQDSVINCEGKNERNDLFCNYGSRHYCVCHHYPNGFKFMRNTCEYIKLPFPKYRINVRLAIKINGNVTHSKLEEKLRKELNHYVGVPIDKFDGAYMVTFIRKKCNKFLQNQIDVYFNIFEPQTDQGFVLNITTMLADIIEKEDNGITILSAKKVSIDRIPRVFSVKHFGPLKIQSDDIHRLNNQEKPNLKRNLLLILTKYHVFEILMAGIVLLLNVYVIFKLSKYYKAGQVRFKQIGEPGLLILSKSTATV